MIWLINIVFLNMMGFFLNMVIISKMDTQHDIWFLDLLTFVSKTYLIMLAILKLQHFKNIKY